MESILLFIAKCIPSFKSGSIILYSVPSDGEETYTNNYPKSSIWEFVLEIP